MKKIRLVSNFASEVQFVYDCTHKELMEMLRRRWPTCTFTVDTSAKGTLETILDNDQPYYFIWVDTIEYKLNSVDFITSIFHEIAHLVFEISRHIGIEIEERGAEEFFTYLQGDYFEQINKKLKILKY